jgi:multidrug resistance efflux pump
MLKKINIFYLIVLLGIGGLYVLTMKFFYRQSEFYGIAENPVRVINLQYAVEIDSLKVKMGESVVKGQLLATVRRTDLPLRYNELVQEIQELQSRKNLELQKLNSDIHNINTKKNQTNSLYNEKISSLEIEKKETDKILKIVKTLPAIKSADEVYTQKINAVKKQKEEELNVNTSELQKIQSELGKMSAPFDAQILRIENEISILKNQEKALAIVAPQDGIVGELTYIGGEKLSAYTPLMKLYNTRPTLVTTYINESQIAKININDQLEVQSIIQKDFLIKGVVKGLGTRVTPMPERLSKMPELKVYGREVQIQITPENKFMQGEKVLIRLLKK